MIPYSDGLKPTRYFGNNRDRAHFLVYQLFLHLNGIEHTRIRVRRPQTNGSVERLNQTVQEEFYKVAFRKKLYRSIEEIQADLDEFMLRYNTERTNQGKYCPAGRPWRPSWLALTFTGSSFTMRR